MEPDLPVNLKQADLSGIYETPWTSLEIFADLNSCLSTLVNGTTCNCVQGEDVTPTVRFAVLSDYMGTHVF